MTKILSIGGEFASNKFIKKNEILDFYKGGTWTFTGRSALEIIIQKKNFYKKNIYIPVFNCPSIYTTVKKYFKKIIFYDLDKNFRPRLTKIKKNSIILIVNYFGLTNKMNFRKDTTVINDLTHSCVQKNDIKKNEYYFLSLRKHGICNFGGWANIISNVKKNVIKPNFLINYRKKKLNYLISNKKNIKIEKNLLKDLKKEEGKIIKNKQIINLTNIQKITNYPLTNIIKIRKFNYKFLLKNIKKDFLKLSFKKNNVPMFFLLKFSTMVERNNFRKKLIQKNIYCPLLWKLNNYNLSKYPISKIFSENLLPVPIDHRIKSRELKYIVEKINSL